MYTSKSKTEQKTPAAQLNAAISKELNYIRQQEKEEMKATIGGVSKSDERINLIQETRGPMYRKFSQSF